MDAAMPLFVFAHLALGEIVVVLALVMAVSGLDDLFVDLVFIGHAAWQRIVGPPRQEIAALRAVPPAPLAIIIPAWDEAAVIGSMLTRLFATLDYPRVRVFVGVYPNDPASLAAVNAIGDPRLAVVVCSRPGPTTKADCLNHLWQALVAEEVTCGERFAAVVLHDAEDVIHRDELWVQNGLMPGLAMVQLPVEPFPDAESRWIAGHYLDEFATGHIKDVVVRAALGAAVPSAGVACAIDRALLGQIADAAGGAPFDPSCLTEDYELGLKIKAMGGATALVRVHAADGIGIVATRENFPASFATARRQKTRWLLGIALAGWDRLGWPGGIADRYMLARDRKAVAAALTTLAAYAVTLLALADVALLHWAFPELVLPPLFGPLATALALANLGLAMWRLVLRAACTGHVYGRREALRAVPRALVSNVINAAAAWSACRRYWIMLDGGGALAWDKTAHRFPASPAG
jgi:adsorption protein B